MFTQGGLVHFEVDHFSVLNSIYRSATLSQTYDLSSLDQSVATTGSSNMSFHFNGSDLLSRIDRKFAYDDY